MSVPANDGGGGLRIITRAEMRMADEIDRGQESGEVRTRADNQHARDYSDKLASLDDLGVSRQRLSEWRETRDAGPAVVERGEFAENNERKPFTWTEAVAITHAVEALERAQAKERQVEGGRSKASAKLAEAQKGQTRDKVARRVRRAGEQGAEMRMAGEIDRGQESGEVHHHGNVQASDITPATLGDLGVSRQRLSEWRETRDRFARYTSRKRTSVPMTFERGHIRRRG